MSFNEPLLSVNSLSSLLECTKCGTSESLRWTKTEKLELICLNCVYKTRTNMKFDLEDDEHATQIKRKQRPTRSYRTRHNPLDVSEQTVTKGRRGLTKKKPVKVRIPLATLVRKDYVFYKDNFIQIGDIVSMKDEEAGIYYAQIRSLFSDQYCDKSAVITWLLPTEESPPPHKMFDPATYILGFEEDHPRSLDCMEFVMHVPSDYYYKSKTTPYPIVQAPDRSGSMRASLDNIKRLHKEGKLTIFQIITLFLYTLLDIKKKFNSANFI